MGVFYFYMENISNNQKELLKINIRYLYENQRHLNSLGFEFFNYLFDVASREMDQYQLADFEEQVAYHKNKNKNNALNYIKSVINKNIYNRIQSYRNQLS